MYRTVLAHPVALCEIRSIEIRNTGLWFYRQGDIHIKSVCVSEFPSLRYSTTTPPPGGLCASSYILNHLHLWEPAAVACRC